MRILLAPVILFVAIGTIAGQSRFTDEEYEIYGLVLTEYFREKNRRDPDNPEKHFVIVSKTGTVDPKAFVNDRSSLYKSFNNRNKSQASLERLSKVSFSYSIADEQEILGWVAEDVAEYDARQEQLRRDGKPLMGGACGPDWKRFYSRFPKSFGYYRLSRIGFSRDHRRAYLEIDGTGSTWFETAAYLVRWTRSGWKTQGSSGGLGVC